MLNKEKLFWESDSWGQLAPVGLPSKVEYCRCCVISNQKPVTKIESLHKKNDIKNTTNFFNGICDACRWADLKENSINWNSRNEELIELCNRYRKNDGNYDVIVPASGGKDSRYVAHLLKYKYGMNPLTVTWKPHIFTNIGFENYISLIDSGQANLMFSPSGFVQRKLSALAFRNLGHPFQPFIVGQRVVGPKAALIHGVKLVFYGENVAEYGNNLEDNFIPTMDNKLYTCYDFNKNNLDNYLLAGVSLSELIKSHVLTLNDLEPYKSPSFGDIDTSGVQVHYMSYYKKWVPQENYYYAVEHTNFKPNDKRKDGSFSKYSGIDDAMEDLHYYMQLIKFGMGRATWDAAQEIRSGKLERDEAVSLIRKYDLENPSEFLPQILDYLDITISDFNNIIDSFRPRHIWNCDSKGNFSLKTPIV